MFKTSKVPAIDKRTVTGNPVKFHSTYALPLDSCKVTFGPSQIGSGDPSPSNIRGFYSFNMVFIVANGNNVDATLDKYYIGCTADIVKGTVDEYLDLIDFGDLTWDDDTYSSGICLTTSYFDDISNDILKVQKSNCFTIAASVPTSGSYIYFGSGNSKTSLYFDFNDLPSGYTQDRAGVIQWLTDNYACLTLPTIGGGTFTPIEVKTQAGTNELSTQLNSLEITFSDLQEKSASGAVATFNTALAMPLPSCNIAVNAWQRGRGDPSPTNIRAIMPYKMMDIVNAFPNLWGGQFMLQTFLNLNLANFSYDGDKLSFTAASMANSPRLLAGVFKPNTQYTFILTGNKDANTATTNLGLRYTDGTISFFEFSGDASVKQTKVFKSYSNKSVEAVIGAYGTGTTTLYYNECCMLEGDKTIDDFVAFNGEYETVAFGQDVYGGIYNSVTGKLSLTHAEISGSYTAYGLSYGLFQLTGFSESLVGYNGDNICSCYIKSAANNINYMTDKSFIVRSNIIYIKDSDYANDLSGFNTFMANNKLVCELATPIEVQLTPTQIETIIGDNNIFADTGDIDLTYKDLDIAKRGNFREVFKLPS